MLNISLFLLSFPISIPERNLYLGRYFFTRYKSHFHILSTLNHDCCKRTFNRKNNNMNTPYWGLSTDMYSSCLWLWAFVSIRTVHRHLAYAQVPPRAWREQYAFASLSLHARYFMGMEIKHKPPLEACLRPHVGQTV